MAGAASIVAPDLFSSVVKPLSRGGADIAISNGRDLFGGTIAAIGELGGMERFVKKGDRVGLLINSDFEIESTYPHPDISIATLKMCFDAGASDVVSLQNIKSAYWDRSESSKSYSEYIQKLRIVSANQFPCTMEAGCFELIPIPGAKVVAEAEMVSEIKNIDVLINIPIGKHHPSTFITGALKNMMGVTSRTTNVTFHLNGPERNDPEYLATCIADINHFRRADLVICDASSFIVTGGPVGPGEVLEPWKIIAGTDMVAIDSMVARLHGYEPEDILTCVAGENMKLGVIDYSSLIISEI